MEEKNNKSLPPSTPLMSNESSKTLVTPPMVTVNGGELPRQQMRQPSSDDSAAEAGDVFDVAAVRKTSRDETSHLLQQQQTSASSSLTLMSGSNSAAAFSFRSPMRPSSTSSAGSATGGSAPSSQPQISPSPTAQNNSSTLQLAGSFSLPSNRNVRPNRVLATDYSQQEPSTLNQSQTLPGGSLLSLVAQNSAPSQSSTAAGQQSEQAKQSSNRRQPRPRHDSESENRILTTSVASVPGSGGHRKTVYTAGRPPWYDWMGNNGNGSESASGIASGIGGCGDKKPFVIGICGGSASGKTTVAKKIVEVLDVQWVSLVSMDSFYKVLDEEQHEAALRSEYNFDHPNAFDVELLAETLQRLKAWKSVEVPIYNFTTHSREKHTRTIYGANVVILEGIMAFCDQSLLDVMDLRIFVDTDADIRLARRLTRDILERGRDLEGVLKQYNKFVKPAYENHIEPTRCKADIVVPRGGDNQAAIKLIAQHVHNQLQARGNIGFRSKLGALKADSSHPIERAAVVGPSTLYVLESTLQVKGMHTIIRNEDTSRDDFIFYSKRLMRLLLEYAVSLLPYQQVNVTTPQGIAYDGQRVDLQRTCAVSILRAGETLEPALRSVLKDIQLGKILIQTNSATGEPELHYHRLPPCIQNYHVLLLDATVSTGSAAIMAIRVLLDHDVKEENIVLVSLLMAQVGAQNVAYCFPRVKIVTTAVDAQLDEKFHIVPGLGNFGDRFFGTD